MPQRIRFVCEKKPNNFKLAESLAKKIYSYLNKEEQEEIDGYMKSTKKELKDVISVLYGIPSQRRRTNPRLTKAIYDYKKNHPNINFVIKTLKPDTKYILLESNNNSEVLYEYKENIADADKLDLWVSQISIADEIKDEYTDVKSINEAVKVNIPEVNLTFGIKLKIMWNLLRRKFSRRSKVEKLEEKEQKKKSRKK